MKKLKLLILLLAVCLSFYTCAGKKETAKTANKLTEQHVISDDSLLTLVEYRTFQYFWDGAEPVSGMARERFHVDNIYPENDKDVVTTGGSGFGIMAVITGIERGFIKRSEGYSRIKHILGFLKRADRFHGAWPHWLYGTTGKVKPFGTRDDGADIVETAYLMQGLLTARQYFIKGSDSEKMLASGIDSLWKEVEWNWFTKGGESVIYWHWSPDFGWQMNNPVEGYNECIILYVLAASSPTFAVSPDVYHKGWARNGTIKGQHEKYGYVLSLNHNGAAEYGGPLFWAHYSYLGLDPRHLKDIYANYWQENVNQALINWQWCTKNTGKFSGYSADCWGLSASYSVNGYSAHAPGAEFDLGVISPTAAVSSIAYTPEQSLKAIKYFYYTLGDKIWGIYGYYDAFSEKDNWYPQRYLAIDQGPQVVMIENYRSGLLWNLFMSSQEVRSGLQKLGFSY
jgi:hypothetical protein